MNITQAERLRQMLIAELSKSDAAERMTKSNNCHLHVKTLLSMQYPDRMLPSGNYSKMLADGCKKFTRRIINYKSRIRTANEHGE